MADRRNVEQHSPGGPSAGAPRGSAQFEALYAAMQTRAVRDATARALAATPAEMGRAAVAAAARARRAQEIAVESRRGAEDSG